jgi:hypothetical protein
MGFMNAARALLVSLMCTACPSAPHAEEAAVPGPAASATSNPPDLASATSIASVAAAESGSSSAAAVPLEVQEHTLDAKVKSLTPIAAKSGNVFPVDADPRFVLELELLGVAPGMADDPKGSALTAGSTVAFAIHSPARVFKAEGDIVGKRLHFSVTRTRTKSGVSFGALHAE